MTSLITTTTGSRLTDVGHRERSVAFQTALHQPITRVRVPKGRRPTIQPDVPRRQPARTVTKISAGRSAEENMNIPSVPVASIKRPV